MKWWLLLKWFNNEVASNLIKAVFTVWDVIPICLVLLGNFNCPIFPCSHVTLFSQIICTREPLIESAEPSNFPLVWGQTEITRSQIRAKWWKGSIKAFRHGNAFVAAPRVWGLALLCWRSISFIGSPPILLILHFNAIRASIKRYEFAFPF